METKQNQLQKIQNFCVLLIAAWIIVPALYGTRDFRYVVVAVSAIWLIVEMAINPRDFLSITWMKITLIGSLVITIIGAFIFNGLPQVRNEINLVICLFIVFIGCQMAKRPKYGFYLDAIVILGLYLYVSLTTIEKLAVDSRAARSIVRNSDEAAALMAENVGGFVLVNFASVMCPILLFLSLKLPFKGYKNVTLRIIAGLSFLMSSLLVFRASYGIAVVTSLLGCLIATLPGRVNKPQYWLAFIMAGSILFVQKEPIFDLAKSLSQGTPLFSKIISIEEMVNFSGMGNEATKGRIERYTRSINSFLASPLIGKLSVRDTGKHSELFDALARYGVIGGLAISGAFFLPLYHFYRIVDPANKKLVLASALCLLMHTTLNKITAGSTLAVFIFMPFAISVIQHSTTDPSQIEHEHIIRG